MFPVAHALGTRPRFEWVIWKLFDLLFDSKGPEPVGLVER
jgi:hypothetical protein